MATPRIEFEKELVLLHKDIIKMGSYIEQAMDGMEEALLTGNIELAKQVVQGDDRVDELERVIVEECLCIIARQQPIATDLRDISTILKIVTDFERIADHCEDISEYVMLLNSLGIKQYIVPMNEILIKVRRMLKDTIEAYMDKNIDLAIDIMKRDDEVDKLFYHLMEELIKKMEADSSLVKQGSYLLYVIKYFERIADHAVNIAEWIYYYVTGQRYVKG